MEALPGKTSKREEEAGQGGEEAKEECKFKQVTASV
jgi:hypothetical protein